MRRANCLVNHGNSPCNCTLQAFSDTNSFLVIAELEKQLSLERQRSAVLVEALKIIIDDTPLKEHLTQFCFSGCVCDDFIAREALKKYSEHTGVGK